MKLQRVKDVGQIVPPTILSHIYVCVCVCQYVAIIILNIIDLAIK
jgi:hypothetical protein